MSGYYPATFGFENVPDGTDDPLWTDNQGSSEIIASLTGHNKVYQCGSGVLAIGQPFDSEQNYGTVELYVNAENAANGFQFRLNRIGVDYAFALRIYGDKFQYATAVQWIDIGKSAFDNTWYHIRIDFETTLGGYMGLSNWTWKAFIDGEEYGAYDFQNNYVPDDFGFYSVSYSTARSWDAVGYSWDSNYDIGDNYNEGLLLSFDTSFTPDWLGYSLDNQPIKTILGNTSILMPENGDHKINPAPGWNQSM